MKTKVVIENNKTQIILTPENDFEIDVLEKACDDNKYSLNTYIKSTYKMGGYRDDFELNVELIKQKK